MHLFQNILSASGYVIVIHYVLYKSMCRIKLLEEKKETKEYKINDRYNSFQIDTMLLASYPLQQSV